MSQPLRIYFFTPFCLLRNTTNRIFDMRMCDAFAGEGCRITIVFPYSYLRENMTKNSLRKNYNIRHPFRVRMLFTPLTENTGMFLRNLILFAAFALESVRILVSNAGKLKNTVVVSREIWVVLPMLMLKKIFGRMLPIKVVAQLHEVKHEPFRNWAFKNLSGLMPNVPKARDIIMQQLNLPANRFCVMNAPMVDFTKTDCTKAQAREKIKYNSSTPLVVYTGKVAKNAAELIYILDAAQLLPGYRFIVTGGKEKNVNRMKAYCESKKLENVTFTGFLPDTQSVRYYQLAADVLVSYYTVKDHLVEYNYPQKLQEYISTGNPVVTPDFEATREVIGANEAFFVKPDDPSALADGIRMAIENKESAVQKATNALAAFKKITYNKKAKEFIAFFRSLA